MQDRGLMKHKTTQPLRHFFCLTLWLAFLWSQLILFSPKEQPPNPLGIDFSIVNSDTKLSSLNDIATKKNGKKFRSLGDAFFNNIDVYYKEANRRLVSSVQCTGRDLQNPELNANFSWMFRSCEFQNLCLDTESKEFILVEDSTGTAAGESREVALGSINPRWSGRGFDKGFHKVKWFPKWVRKDALQGGYYELPDDVVLVPFHSMAAHNVGHLLWDDFYPIFTLLNMFAYTSDPAYQILMLRWAPEKKLYATCNMRKNKAQQCDANFQRFLPLLGVNYNTFSSVKQAELKPSTQPIRSKYVCSKHAVAGMGMLMDHGTRDHGWTLRDPNSGLDLVPHNTGRGGIFREFRDFLVQNMGFPLELPRSSRRKITFSTHSSRGFERDLSFESQIAVIRTALGASSKKSKAIIQNITMRDLSLEDQIQVALESAIYVTVCGGGAVTASFLPPGSTLIIYYAEDGGMDFWKYNYTSNLPEYDFQAQPARLDWDLLGNAAHLKVHWLPLKTMEHSADLKVLEKLVLHDLEDMDLL